MRVPSFIYNGTYTDCSAKHLEFEGFRNKRYKCIYLLPKR